MPGAVREYQDQLVETACNLIGLINDRRRETVSIVILVTDHHCDTDVRRLPPIHPRIRSNGAQFFSVGLERGKLRVRATPRPATLPYLLEIVAGVTASDAHIR